MHFPFTREQFFDVFKQYNEAVWPAQWLLVALAVAALLLAVRGTARSGRIIAAILALLWLWMGIVYPLLGAVQGHRYPAAPTFGLPCPTTLFTLGLLMWAAPRTPRLVLVIPILWAVVGTSAAVQLGVWEDAGLAVAAVLTVVLEYISGRHDHRFRHIRAAGTLARES
ncbi:MAG TPA: DUF6064 family protein [Gemmatimonadaceae bacterium]|nr:DUF6064 family protein [Gemmatimonadaceae bacterium]